MGRDPRTDPARVSRHWLVLAVATLLTLAYGTRVPDANDRRIAPANLRTPPKALDPTHLNPRRRLGRTVSVIRHGIGHWLRRFCSESALAPRLAASRVWPEPKPNLEIPYHAPT